MNWTEERWSGDKGYRAVNGKDAGSVYVGKTKSGWWKVWIQTPEKWVPVNKAFSNAGTAKSYAENAEQL
jgi:hypothetical protein